MPKPSRPGQNTRRPRVAGLRKHSSERTQQAENRQSSTGPNEQEPATDASDIEPTAASGGASGDEAPAAEAETEATREEAAHAAEPTEHDPAADGPDEPEVEQAEAGNDDAAAGDGAAGGSSGDTSTALSATAPEPVETSEERATPSGTDAFEESDGTPPESDGTPSESDGTPSESGKRGFGLPALLVGLSVVCLVLAVVFGMQTAQLRGDGAGSNQALTDSAATSQVNGQISEAVAKVFSYDFADTAKTEKAANELLVGDAVGKYNELFATIKEQAPQQKLVVTTTVKTSAVKLLQDDRAEVLLFVDQNAVRTDSGENNIGAAQILVGAEKHGDQWKISQITQR